MKNIRLYANYSGSDKIIKNVIKSFEMLLDSKGRTEKLKTKTQRIRNVKSQNSK